MPPITRALIAAVLAAAAAAAGGGVVALDGEDPTAAGAQRISAAVGSGAPAAAKQLKALQRSAAPKTTGAVAKRERHNRRVVGTLRGLNRTAALNVARRVFPDLVNQKGFRARRPQKDMRLLRLTGTFESQVVTDEGAHLLAKSTVPLRARRPDGSFTPVDMTLERTAAGDYAPRDVVAPVTLGSTADEGVHLRGADVTTAPARARAVTGVRNADTVFYPNV